MFSEKDESSIFLKRSFLTKLKVILVISSSAFIDDKRAY